MDKWCVVYCKPRMEVVAARNLELQDYTVYLPMLIEVGIKGNFVESKKSPMFTRYLFLKKNEKFDPYSINSTKGVVNIVSFNGKSATLEEQAVTEIRRRETALNTVNRSPKVVNRGIRRLKLGSFAEIPQDFFSYSESERTMILMGLIGTESSMSSSQIKLERKI